jgi:hypothetical protein
VRDSGSLRRRRALSAEGIPFRSAAA